MKTAEAIAPSSDSKDEIIAFQANLIRKLEAMIDDLVVNKDAHIEQLTLKLEATQRQLSTLQHQIEQLIRRIYGRKSEKIDPNQMMFDSIIQESLAQSAAIVAKDNNETEAATVIPATVSSKPRKERTNMAACPFPSTWNGWK